MDLLLKDIRLALRALAHRPAFAAAAITSLAIGMAATSAVFSIANGLLFKPVPGVTRPEGLVEIARSVQGQRTDVTWQVFDRLRQERPILEGLGALVLTQVSILTGDEPVTRGALAVTGNYFDLLGVRAALGRTFAPDEASWPRVAPVAVVSHEAWQRELNGAPDVIGRVVRINGVPVEIVGVLAAGFTGHHTALLQDVFLPLGLAMPGLPQSAVFTRSNSSSLELLGRLAPGVSPERAADELSAVADRLERETAGVANRAPYRLAVEPWGPLPGTVRGGVAAFLSVLLVLVGLALAMACVNVTTILLARALDRQRELAVRRAIGATRGRLVRQVITEVTVLFAIAGAAGLLLSIWATGLLTGFAPPVPIPGRLGADFAADGRVLLFSLAVTFGTAVAFSLLPALNASRFDIVSALKEGGSSETRGRNRLRALLVGAQLAFTTVLVIATTLFARAIDSIHALQPEWDLDGVLVSAIDLELNGATPEAGLAFAREARDRIAALPGVEVASFAAKLPIGGRSSFGLVYRLGTEPTVANGLYASVSRVSPHYLRSMGIPLRAGRDFAATDGASAPAVAIVNETMARRLWATEPAVGQRFFVGEGAYRREFEVVGVAGASRLTMPGEPQESQYYVPLEQAYTSQMVLHVRTAPGAAGEVARAARGVLRAGLPTLPIPPLRPITEALELFLLPQRLAAWVAASMGLFGLILAGVGVYGVTAFAVSRRAREIAIRIALGATPRDVTLLVLRRGVRAPLIGIAVGLTAGVGLSVALAATGVVPGVQPADPLAAAGTLGLLVLIALAAMSDPVRRVVRRPAMRVLREE
ncbi:MAG TPA: ADOP family duplicated permease [Gemmatimonadaceae bacterium]|nr:ADOP family duplicated permease [Gemmatimonadaceae bacterium]